MFNIGGGEVLVILLLALIVLGPQRLPDAARQVGKFMGDLRRMSSGFQQELRAAMDDPLEAAARERGAAFKQKAADAPAVAPVPKDASASATTPATPATKATKATNATKAAKATEATKAAPRRRSAPLRAVPKPDDGD